MMKTMEGKTHIQRLEESVESWHISAEYEKHQAYLSLAIFGGGTALFAAGLIGAISGAPEVGISAMVIGGGTAEGGRRMIKGEIESAMEIRGKEAVQQYRLENRQ